MSSTAASIANTVEVGSAESNNAINQSHRGAPRNRNRHRSRNENQDGNRAGNQARSTPQKSRWTGGRSRGGGDFGMHRMSLQERNEGRKGDSSTQPGPSLDLLPSTEGSGTFGARLITDATTTEGEAPAKINRSEGGEDEDADVCFICASPVVHGSVAPCNHRTCHICALRLRALYKTTACAHCRVSFTSGLVSSPLVCQKISHSIVQMK